jgi:hypothetical protein
VGVFEIELLSAHWLTAPGHSSEWDTCAHGEVRVRIGAAEVVVDDLNLIVGTREALRTLEEDRAANPDWPLLPHACSAWMGCPNVAIDWSVRHSGAIVYLGDLHARDGDAVMLEPGSVATVAVPGDVYRDAVAAFAGEARAFYGPPDQKIFPEAWERELFDEIWVDLGARLQRSAEH